MPVQGTSLPDRLQKRSDFLRLRDGRKWVAPTLIVQTDTAQTPALRVGYTATKKLGGAVVRNRIKRRLRAAAREALQGFSGACDIVLIGRPETATCPYQTLVKDLKWCLKRLDIKGPEKNHETHPDHTA